MSARRRLPALAMRALCSWGAAPHATTTLPTFHLAKSALPHLFSPSSSALPLRTRPILFGFRHFAAASDLPAHTELAMPALSPTMNQGNILSWKKAEGDPVQPGDIYCEVETDKATIEWESQEEGFLAKILVPEGSKNVDVGTPVAVLVEEADDVEAFKDYAPGGASSSTPAAEAAAPASSSSGGGGGSFPAHEIMDMPALSPTMTQGNILSWKKDEGDEVQPGDIIAEVETDKATIEWEAQEEGVIAKILVPGGSSGVEVGSPVLVMVDDKGEVASFANFTMADATGGGGGDGATAAAAAPADTAPPPPSPTPTLTTPTPAAKPAAAPSPGGRIIASPYAKKLANEAGVSLAGVGGSGPGGRIVAADVQQLIASGGAARPGVGAVAGGAPILSAYTDVEATQIRKITARRLLESKQQIPHYYLTVSCRIDALSVVRSALNTTLAAGSGSKLSVNDFVIKASALALRAVPDVNASWMGDFIRQYHTVDCSVAVQTPAGLMVPVIRNADQKGLASISTEVRSLADKAKTGALSPEEFIGGTFTISNLGMFGVSQFAAIVNPPQACILAVGSAEKKVVPAAGGGFEEGTFMTVTLSCDHRVVDGAVGAQWLKAFKGYIEDPASMLL